MTQSGVQQRFAAMVAEEQVLNNSNSIYFSASVKLLGKECHH